MSDLKTKLAMAASITALLLCSCGVLPDQEERRAQRLAEHVRPNVPAAEAGTGLDLKSRYRDWLIGAGDYSMEDADPLRVPPDFELADSRSVIREKWRVVARYESQPSSEYAGCSVEALMLEDPQRAPLDLDRSSVQELEQGATVLLRVSVLCIA